MTLSSIKKKLERLNEQKEKPPMVCIWHTEKQAKKEKERLLKVCGSDQKCFYLLRDFAPYSQPQTPKDEVKKHIAILLERRREARKD